MSITQENVYYLKCLVRNIFFHKTMLDEDKNDKIMSLLLLFENSRTRKMIYHYVNYLQRRETLIDLDANFLGDSLPFPIASTSTLDRELDELVAMRNNSQ